MTPFEALDASTPPEPDASSDFPLQPPGSILVLGTDWAGLETALYGRFLGYDVIVWGLRTDGQPALGPTLNNDWWAKHWLGDRSIDQAMQQPIPMLPTRCLSTLAIDALMAQTGDGRTLRWPETMADWINHMLSDLVGTDLLADRVDPYRILQSTRLIEAVDEDGDAVPSDFEATAFGANDPQTLTTQTVEAIIDTIGGVEAAPTAGTDYYFQVQSPLITGDAEAMMRDVQRQIVSIFAILADRADLDLYRPRRH